MTAAPATHDHVAPGDAGAEVEEGHRVERSDLARIAFLAVTAAVAWLLPSEPAWLVIGGGAATVALGAWPVLREAGENVLERRMTTELSMTIALLAALAIGEVFVAAVIAAFVVGAEVLEDMTVARGRRAIQDLLRYLPRIALVRREGEVAEIAIDELRPGDLVLVNPGAAIPVDGTVVAGASHVDEATITGEPMPVEKGSGDHVYASTVNQSGALEVRAERIGRDSTFGKIVEAVEHAERSRAPVEKTADRFAGYLVYFALGAAALTFLLTRDARSTISVVIVAGACGMAAGTPLAILGAVGRSARQGAIIKGGRYLETLWAVDTVVLDKTGTLTYGTPVVQAIYAANGTAPDSILAAAAAAEVRSEHPLGRAIVAHARATGVAVTEPEEFAYTPGKGVVALFEGVEVLAGTRAFTQERGIALADLQAPEGAASEVVVTRGGQLLGTIVIADTLRDEAAGAVRDLRTMGVQTVLLTGDRPAAAEAIASELGVDDYAGGMLPDQKLERVRALVAAGRTVAMVGDGVNDAPALAQASVGIAMGSGTDVTRESAHVVLIGNDLSKFVETLRVARRTRRIILQNFAGTIGIDLAGMGLAAFGLLGPLVAAAIHVVSELTFLLNSARLLPARAPGDQSERGTDA
ncbi:MAG: cation-translocating P-type ATPase [Dehalococcoidia bacterium]